MIRTHGSGERKDPIFAFGWVRLAMLLRSGCLEWNTWTANRLLIDSWRQWMLVAVVVCICTFLS